MFKKITLIISFVSLLSCTERLMFGSVAFDPYYIYIAGDSGRSVTISYLNKAVRVTETVKLPYYNAHRYYRDYNAFLSPYLKVETSDDDSTTQALIFHARTLYTGDSSICFLETYYNGGNFRWSAHDTCHKKIGIDSVFAYVKKIQYPGYMSFAKGDRTKFFKLHDADD